MWLNRTGLAIVALGHIENDCVCVQLRCDIAVDRAGRIVLKLGRDKLAGGFGRMVAADTRLCVVFELVERNADALAMRLANTLITAD